VRTEADIPAAESAHRPVDRAAALVEGAPRVPRRVVYIAVVVAAVLALGGTLLERLFSSAGINPTAAPANVSASSMPSQAPPLSAPLAAFLGIVHLRPVPAPAVSLVDQNGANVTLDQLRGKVIVVTFFDANCQDACPVLADEIRQADAALGPTRERVVFLTINTDPLHTATTPAPAAVTETGLAALGNWHFLTGSLATLDAVWRNYGVTINVATATGAVAHNSIMYFADQNGNLRIRATPVADEAADGAYSLAPASVARSGTGIASYAAGLLVGPG
jgi:cytochrome oxidase Cu insertion factor (SCO1/SenC/PrrC family)